MFDKQVIVLPYQHNTAISDKFSKYLFFQELKNLSSECYCSNLKYLTLINYSFIWNFQALLGFFKVLFFGDRGTMERDTSRFQHEILEYFYGGKSVNKYANQFFKSQQYCMVEFLNIREKISSPCVENERFNS